MKTESDNYHDDYEVGEHGNDTVTTIKIRGRESDEGYMGQWELYFFALLLMDFVLYRALW